MGNGNPIFNKEFNSFLFDSKTIKQEPDLRLIPFLVDNNEFSLSGIMFMDISGKGIRKERIAFEITNETGAEINLEDIEILSLETNIISPNYPLS